MHIPICFPILRRSSMYTSTDLSIITDPYFNILQLKDNLCEIQSNNTKHSWIIQQSNDNVYAIFHKHKSSDPYHFHAAYSSIQDCLLEITQHDEYQIRGRKPDRHPSKHTFFYYIIDQYKQEEHIN